LEWKIELGIRAERRKIHTWEVSAVLPFRAGPEVVSSGSSASSAGGAGGGSAADYDVIKEKIRIDLKRCIQKNTSRRPLIMPVILEI
jgi:hypothetical protein